MSLEIKTGERLGIVGENGAGKSSLMNVLFGLYQPDAGELVVDGAVRRFASPKDAIAAGIGMVHQHFMLVAGLSVLENLILGDEFVESPQQSTRPWVMRVLSMEMNYSWLPEVGYWRVISSVVTGVPVSGRAPTTCSWTFGQRDKPLWVAALEHEHYPREIWKRSPQGGHSNF